MSDQFENYSTRFKMLSDVELVEAFNQEVGRDEWTSSRADYLTALYREFKRRQWDFSAIGDENSLSFKDEIRLVDGKVEVVRRE